MAEIIRKLSSLDATFLYLETPEMPMHVGSMAIFRLPDNYQGDFYEAFKAMIGSRLHLAPILRWRLDKAPLELDNPSWVEDDQFEIERHIFRGALPAPHNQATLQRIVGWMHAKLLNRARPLWEIYVFEGLDNNEVAIYSKIHHACVDGGAGAALFEMIHDISPVPRDVPPPDGKPAQTLAETRGAARQMLTSFLKPAIDKLLASGGRYVPEVLKAEGGTSVASIVDICLDQLQQPVKLLRDLPQILPTVGQAIGQVASPSGLRDLRKMIAPSTPINAPISSERSFAGVSLPLSRIKAVAAKGGGKLNDGVLAICAGALSTWLKDRNALPDRPLTAFVPIAVREQGDKSASNQVTGMICPLGTDIEDPKERLEAIIRESGRAKELSNPMRTLFPHMSNLSLLWAPMAAQLAVLFISRSGMLNLMPPLMNVIISNVPGPRIPMYAAGAELQHSYPVSIVTHGMGLNITVQSYRDRMDFGLISGANLLPNVQEIADSFPLELEKLERALGVEPPAARPEKPARAALPAAEPVVSVPPAEAISAEPVPAAKPRRTRVKAEDPKPEETSAG